MSLTSYPHRHLLVLLDALTGHAVDDRIETRIHVALLIKNNILIKSSIILRGLLLVVYRHIGNTEHSDGQNKTRPEEQVEDCRVLVTVEDCLVQNVTRRLTCR